MADADAPPELLLLPPAPSSVPDKVTAISRPQWCQGGKRWISTVQYRRIHGQLFVETGFLCCIFNVLNVLNFQWDIRHVRLHHAQGYARAGQRSWCRPTVAAAVRVNLL